MMDINEIYSQLERLACELSKMQTSSEVTTGMIRDAWDHVCRAEELILKVKLKN
jgi:hypothetical protein